MCMVKFLLHFWPNYCYMRHKKSAWHCVTAQILPVPFGYLSQNLMYLSFHSSLMSCIMTLARQIIITSTYKYEYLDHGWGWTSNIFRCSQNEEHHRLWCTHRLNWISVLPWPSFPHGCRIIQIQEYQQGSLATQVAHHPEREHKLQEYTLGYPKCNIKYT